MFEREKLLEVSMALASSNMAGASLVFELGQKGTLYQIESETPAFRNVGQEEFSGLVGRMIVLGVIGEESGEIGLTQDGKELHAILVSKTRQQGNNQASSD